MKLTERLTCPFCKNSEFKTLYKKSYSDYELKNFINKYYKSEVLDRTLKFNIYELCECIKCSGIFQKYQPDEKLSNFLYDEIISAENSLEKKDNFIKQNEKKLRQDLVMISSLFSNASWQILHPIPETAPCY